MLQIVNFFVILSILVITAKLLFAKNVYEKILSFYFIFTNIIILILVDSTIGFESILDIIILLLLLKIVAVLFLLLNRKKI